MTNKEKATAVLNALASGDLAPVEKFIDDSYIQHNLSAPSGKAAFLGMVPMLAGAPDTKVNIVRTLEDDNFVAVHTEYFLKAFGGALVGFDVFRFENGMIVEHWDNLQAIVEKTESGRSQTDGPTEISDLDTTAANKALTAGFVKDILIGEHPDKIADYISTEKYHQHNPSVGDGLSALGSALQGMADAGTPMVYSKNHLLVCEGDFALAASEGQFLGDHVAFYDLVRFENGLITEHWDTIQGIPPKSEWKNDNGKF